MDDLNLNLYKPWTPRSILRETEPKPVVERVKGRALEILKQVLVAALAPFAEAREALCAASSTSTSEPPPIWSAHERLLRRARLRLDAHKFALERLAFEADLRQKAVLQSSAHRMLLNSTRQ